MVARVTRVTRVTLGCAVLLAVALAGRSGAAPEDARSAPLPCKIPGLAGRALCGTLPVRESAASGRMIRIVFAVVPARRRNLGAVFEVGGGPGQSAIDGASGIDGDPELGGIHRDHDLVFVDQRGTGRSGILQCPQLFASRAHAFAELFPSVELRACRTRLARVADLNAYGTDRAADDLDAVRALLGHETISFDTGSYGSQFAFVYLRRHPEHVRALLLGGVAPTYIKLPLPFSRGAQHALDGLIASCGADARCARAYPDLRAEWDALVAGFAHGPLRVTFPDHGRTTSVLLSHQVFADRMRQALYDPFSAAALPAIIDAAAHGDTAPLGRLIALIIDSFAGGIAQGENLSVACAEDVAFITPAQRAQAAHSGFLGDLRIRAQQRACRMWNVRPVPRAFLDPVRSRVPVLMISGTDDPATPAWLGASQLPYLPNARQIMVPGGGHDNTSPCLTRVRLAFLDDPRPAAVSASCAAANQRPPFVLDLPAWFARLK
jgi:pimeloyl-ACP methyl ester carboxylesterase